MGENTIKIIIEAFDNASATITAASKKMSTSLGEVESAEKGLATAASSAVKPIEDTSRAQEKAAGTAKQATTDYKGLVVGVSGVATASFALYNAWDSVGDAAVGVSRANLAVKSSADAVEGSQRKYNETVAKYGSISPEAIAAEKDLQLAQERHTVAVERADMVQGNYGETMVKAALSVIPTAITMVSSLSAVHNILTTSTAAGTIAETAFSWAKMFAIAPTATLSAAMLSLNAILAANPIIIVVLAIAGLVAALIAAYTYCKPFKDAVDAIGKALGEGLKWAIDLVVGALTWLWENILKPIADFLGGTLFAAINAVAGAFGWLADTIGGGLAWLDEQFKKATGTWNDTIVNGMNDNVKAVEDGMNAQLEVVKKATEDQLAAEQTAYDDRTKAAQDFWNAFIEPPKDAWQEIIDSVNGKYDDSISDLENWAADEKSAITTHYDDQIADVNDKYAQMLEDTNNYYDELIDITQSKLDELRIGRQKDLDHLELEYLRRKKLIQDEVIDKSLSADEILALTESKNARLEELEDMYRSVRSEMTEGYRLKELEAEEANNANVEAVNAERAVKIQAIEESQATEVKRLSDEKGATILRVEKETNDMVEYYNNERKDTLERIRGEQLAIETEHQRRVKEIVAGGEAEQNTIITAAYAEKQRIISEALAKIEGMYAAQYKSASALAAGMGAGTYTSPEQLAASVLAQAGGSVTTAIQIAEILGKAEGWTQAQIDAFKAMISSSATKAVPVMGEGGVVTAPTLALIGESGPEAVVPLGSAGLGSVINNFAVSINVEGSVDERTLAVLREELRSVIVEATSVNAPTNLKRIRNGSLF